MPVSLSVKNVPDEQVARLRERAAANHRSLQGELMALIEAATIAAPVRKKSIDEILADARQGGYRSASTSVAYIREDRDAEDR